MKRSGWGVWSNQICDAERGDCDKNGLYGT